MAGVGYQEKNGVKKENEAKALSNVNSTDNNITVCKLIIRITSPE